MSPDPQVKVVKRTPSVAEYQMLRATTGWADVDDKTAQRALENTLFSVVACVGGEAAGCGRVVGDGGTYFYIQDVIVLPEFQDRGIGALLMDGIMGYLKENAPPGSFIGLMAAKDKAGFYKRYGFVERPGDAPGMYLDRGAG